MSLSETEIADAKARYGEVWSITALDGELEVLVRKPSLGEWRKYKTAILSEDQKVTANEDLARATVIDPPAQEFAELLKSSPALCDELSKHLAKLAGLSANSTIKKL